ncbi:aldehyde dehydrogenase family protein [Aquibacillus koreensis]|uniref:3-sulfolactaldehyde dehydrogenase n=1 Tax=Aquibacillus koreensis TaxID=279446 RepID=A0A9X4AIP9_9BACI|nr:aldehyde dehydrogenase family protein [Aquibacillus koreensis]MCT2537755.1 aldehyde dehydrogenase family protein [Aquibacillus koreensis]MDC3421211.1 aldehyde dehydrogenase family protein [Aquibacillus koreensis]
MKLQVKHEKMLLAGQWIESDRSFEVYNPQNNQVIARVPKASESEMLLAIDKAHKAYQTMHAWPTHDRIRVLNKAAAYMEEHKERFAETIALEGSKTINEARGEVTRSIQTIRISAEEARRINGQTINFDQSEGSENRVGYSYRFPIGVVGAITPFNDPLNLVAHKVGPAIAAGNAVVVKPASVTPLSALLLAEAFMKAGLPAGILSVITGSGREIGETLITHPYVKMISFTGGVDAGERIAHQAGIKKVNMELGSNSPVIVLSDADFHDAVKSCVSGAFSAVGQNCIGVQRIYVEKDIYASFLEEFKARTKELRVGDKLDELTDMGPLINEKEAKRVEEWVDEAVQSGATLQAGGVRKGTFYDPTILTDVPNSCKIANEEIFGPVVLIYQVENVNEAVERANDVDYGLQAGVFTSDINKAYYTIQNLHVGGVMVNDSSDYRIDAMPFGGVKNSGLGREGVRSAVEAMTEEKVVSFRLQQQLL